MKNLLVNLTNENKNIDEIASILKKPEKEIRLLLLKYSITPGDRIERDYQEYAKALNIIKNECYFYSEMAKKLDISLNKVINICKMYDIEPNRQSNCTVCGNTIELDIKSKHLKKYCSKKCANKAFNISKIKSKKPIIKHCSLCGESFEGGPNSKYCTEWCKSLAKDIKGVIKCLKNL
ncbi:hypothetical protein [Terrisporobacter sp.]|uniref:hypothetical protein n=1 Tax=Terrisporobacter sp. TaxID=1965305 RepID=UPI0039968652